MSRKIKKNKRKKKNVQGSQAPLTVDQACQLAEQHFQSGNHLQAEQVCQQVLKIEPDNTSCNYLLGIIFAERGIFDSATQYLQKAAQSDPGNAVIQNNLGNALAQSGKPGEALECYRKAVSLNPNNAHICYNLGNAYKEAGRFEESVASYKKAISLDPQNPEPYNNLGVVYQELEKLDLAQESYMKAISLKPDHAVAHQNLGRALKATGRLEESITSFRRAISINPDFAEAYNNLGITLQAAGKQLEAIGCFKQAVALKPSFIQWYNLGSALQEMDMIVAAADSLNKALSFKPDDVHTLYLLSLILKKEDKMEEAIAGYKHVLSLDSEYELAYNNLGGAFLDMGIMDESLANFKKAVSIKPDLAAAHSNILLVMNYSSTATQQKIYAASRDFGKAIADSVSQCTYYPRKRDIAKRKLKIGYVSPDFKTHSVAYFFVPLLGAHDRQDFEIYCYSDVKKPDNVTEQIKKEADHWRQIAWQSHDDVISQLRRDRIDILVDLTGHTGGNRLEMFAAKAAPVQVTWLGYPSTTGLKEMDYRITDAVADPVGVGDDFYTEELIRLEGCFLCYQPYENGPEVSAPPCLQSDIVTFGSFNNLAKLTPGMIKVWAEILLQVPNSLLVLKSNHLSYKSVVQRYKEMFAEYGVTNDRIECMGKNPYLEDHLATYNRVDIALDTSPYNGTTTTCEALWMGVPVITLLGERHASRVGMSIMQSIGMTDELVAENISSYINKAVALSENKSKLTHMRNNLRRQMLDSPLCDAVSFARRIEKIYRNMWTRYTDSYEQKN